MLSSAASISWFDAEAFEEPGLARVEPDARHQLGLGVREELDHLLVELLAVDPQRVEVGAEEVAHGAQREAEIAVEQARRPRHRRAPLDPAPQRLEERGVGGEILARPSFGFGARDQAGGRRLALGEDGAQARALGLVLDPARDAEVRRAGKEDQVAAGQRDVRAHPRALAGERVLAHLDHDLLSLLEQVDDRGAAGRHFLVFAVVVAVMVAASSSSGPPGAAASRSGRPSIAASSSVTASLT